MPLPSYRVLSPVYIAPPPSVRVIPKKIAHQDIKSMQGMAIERESTEGGQPTVGSYGHAQPTQIFTKEGVVTKTANNRFVYSHNDFIENGPLYNNDEYGHGHWKAAGEDNPSYKHNVILKMPEVMALSGITPLGLYLHPGDTQVNLRTIPELVNAFDPNRKGFYESKKANIYQDLRGLMFDDINRLNYEASEWIGFLAKKGYSIETSKTAGVLSLGVKHGKFAAAYHPKHGYLVSEMDFHEKAKNIVSRYGLDDREAIDAMKRAVLLHEFGHMLGVEGDRKGEKLQGLLQAEFYSMMAERFKGTKMERIYRALAQEGIDYARWYSRLRLFDIKADEDESIDFLIAKFEADGRRAFGLKGKELEDYVNARVYETFGAMLGNGAVTSYKKTVSKSSKSKENKSRESLEKIVEDSDSKHEGNSEKTYERKLDKSDYKSMKDVREREEAESKEAESKAEATEASE